jgi:hypothetical protein
MPLFQSMQTTRAVVHIVAGGTQSAEDVKSRLVTAGVVPDRITSSPSGFTDFIRSTELNDFLTK